MEKYYVYRSGEQGIYVVANSSENAVIAAMELHDFGNDEVFAVLAEGDNSENRS